MQSIWWVLRLHTPKPRPSLVEKSPASIIIIWRANAQTIHIRHSNRIEKGPSIGRLDFWYVNLDLYSRLCILNITGESVFSSEDPALQFSHLVTSTASTVIPKTHCKPKIPKVPWFTNQCSIVIKKKTEGGGGGGVATSCFWAHIWKQSEIQHFWLKAHYIIKTPNETVQNLTTLFH